MIFAREPADLADTLGSWLRRGSSGSPRRGARIARSWRRSSWRAELTPRTPTPRSRRPRKPLPGDVEAARAHYKRGVQLYEQGSYEPALSELQRAEQLAPTYKLSYNIALVQVRLGNAASALRSFRSYLDAGGSEIPAARRTEVEGYLADLVGHVATIDVTVNVGGAEVSLDERPIGTAPLFASLEVNPGPHRITATKAGYAPMTREIDAVPGERVALPFTLGPLEAGLAPAPVPSPVPVPVPVPSPAPVPALTPAQPPPLWIGWTATAVLASGAVATGVAALVESHLVAEDVNDHATSAAAIHSAHQSTVTLALTSDILTASALASAIVTGYFLASSKRRDHDPAEPPHADVRVGAGLGTLTLSGTF